jgi:hypothetical protein
MSRIAGLFCVLALAALVSSCDSDQPLQSGSGDANAVLFFELTALPPGITTVWDTWFDSNGNQVLDAGDEPIGIECLTTPPTDPKEELVQRAAPWLYSVRVQILRAGGTEVEVLTEASAATSFSSVTPSNPTPLQATTGEMFDPNTSTIYVNPRLTYTTDREYRPVCAPLVSLPPSDVIGGLDAPIGLELAQGDTLMVEAVLFDTPPAPINLEQPGNVVFQGRLIVNGAEVQPDGIFRAEGAGARLQFSYRND